MLVAGTVLALVSAFEDSKRGGQTAAAKGATEQETTAAGAGVSEGVIDANQVNQVVATAIVVDAAPAVAVDAAPVAVARVDPAVKPKPRPKVRTPRPKQTGAGAASTKNGADDAAVSKKAVHAKFSALSREYRAFKKSYGSRLEKEWADLATYLQYAQSQDKLRVLDRKMDAFRSRMRKAKNGGG